MAIAGEIIRASLCSHRAAPGLDSERHRKGFSFAGKWSSGEILQLRRQKNNHYMRPRYVCRSTGFYDCVSPFHRGGKETREKTQEKKKKKLIKYLVRNLKELSEVGFGNETDKNLIDEVRKKIISEAASVLLTQLEQLRAEEKEKKRLRKKENKLATLNRLEMETLIIPKNVQSQEQKTEELSKDVGERIEVCMGGKCKKSGAMEVLMELERVVGVEGGVVVGCRCMGKCKKGPNVKIMEQRRGSDCLRAASVFTDVGLEDVEGIVRDFLGKDDTGLLAD